MSIPTQEIKESYSYDEVQHLIAREWAKNEIVTLKAGQLEIQKKQVELTGMVSSNLQTLQDLVSNFPLLVAKQVTECRDSVQKEIAQDFPSRLETMDMERRIEKKIGETDETLGKQIAALDRKVDNIKNEMDRMWLKITVVVGTIVAIGGIIQWLLSTARTVIG